MSSTTAIRAPRARAAPLTGQRLGHGHDHADQRRADGNRAQSSLGPATEQTAFDLKNAGLSVGDIDGNSGSETVTLAVGQGVLNVTAGTSGAGFRAAAPAR